MKKLALWMVISAVLFCGALSGQAKAGVVVDKWEIPFITVLSGAISHIGLEIEWAVKKAVEEINEAGGIAGKPMTLKTFDSGYDPTRAVSCMKEAVKGSHVIIGPMSTMEVRACSAIAARQGVMCLPVASSISEVGKVYPWAVVFIPSMEYLYRSTLDWYKLKPDIKSIVIFRDTKNPVWREAGSLVKKFSKDMGVKVLDIIDVDASSVDVSSPAVRGLGKKPNGYFLCTEPAQTARIILELQDRGWKDNEAVSCHTAIACPTFLEVGSGRLDGVYFIGMPYNYDLPNPRWQSFIKEFGAAHGGGKPAMYVPPYFDAPYAIKEAIEKTGVTGDPAKLGEERVKIRDYIRSMKGFEGVYKAYDMSEGGWALLPGALAQVKKNNITFVGK